MSNISNTRTPSDPQPVSLTHPPEVCGHTQTTQQPKALKAGAWEVREVQRRIHFHGPYGNSVVCAADALDSADPNRHVCVCWMVNSVERGVTLTPGIWVSILKEGFHKHSHAASRPLGLWFVNELLYWLASSLASLEDTNNTPCFLFSPSFYSTLILCTERKMWAEREGGGGHYRMLLYVWLKSSGLSSVSPPLLWLPFFSPANLYCGNLRQLSSAQWCKRTNLMPHSPASLSYSPHPHTPISGRPWPRTSLL